jgi:hypothetical protein
MKVILGVVVFCILQVGCSSSYDVSSSPNADKSFSTFNTDAYDKSGVIVFQDDREMDARSIVASTDSTRFLNVATDSITVVPTHAVKRVVFKNRLIGSLEWAGIGAVVLGGIGLMVSADNVDASGVGAVYAVLGAPAGAVIGGIGGVIAGHRYKYQFPPSVDSAKK